MPGGTGGGGPHPYRPKFISQLNDPDASHEYEMTNCVFAAGAMALERHTMGAVQISTMQLRQWSNRPKPVSVGWGTLNSAWRKAADEVGGAKGYPELHLEVARDGWNTFLDKIRAGRGALLGGKLQEIPARYSCVCAGRNRNGMHNCFKGNHAVFINEIRANGDMLVFDSSCDPRDKLGDIDRGSLEPGWTSENTEAQPKWVPQQYMKHYALTYTRSQKADVAYTRITPNTDGGGVAGQITPIDGDVFAVYTQGWWEQFAQTPSQPGEPAILSKEWRTHDQVDGFFMRDKYTLASPEQVIAGEEGRVDAWEPTAHGYGRKGKAIYHVPLKNWAFKTLPESWHIQPWDIPIERFWLQPPPWPEGVLYLAERLDRHNRANGVQAVEIINRENIWEKVELGAELTLDLSLQGPHPEGFRGVVRVVGYMPDEDAGTMQLMTEWVTSPDDGGAEDPTEPPDVAVEEIIADARSMLGVPWVLGAESRTQTDCSGLIYRVFTDTGHGDLIGNDRKTSAGYTRWFADRGWFTQDRSVAKRGDLVVYAVAPTATHRVSHIGIYLGNNKVISALFATGVTRHHIDSPEKEVKGILRVQYPDESHPGPDDPADEDPEDPDIPDDGGPPDEGDDDDPVTPPLGDPALVFYSMRVDGKPYVNGMMYSLCTLLRKLGYVVPKHYGMTLRIASGVPLKKNGVPQGTSIADTKTALAELIPDAAISYGSMTGAEIITTLADDKVIRVIAQWDELPKHLRRWIKDDPYKGNHAITLGKTRMHNNVREVFWMDPMGKPATGYSGEWVQWNDVDQTLLRNRDGIRVTYTDPE